MVTRSRLRSRDGKVRLGCLVWALIALGLGYAGIEYGRVYWTWFATRQEIEEMAGFAGQLEETAIRRRIVERVVALDLPPEARQVRVWRVNNPRGLRIALAYSDSVDLLVTKQEIKVTIKVSRAF